jgi:glycosyltransferase involved in cell wall biosynthesis
MKVSVAIPSYKFAPYIEECVNSVLNQITNFDFEIVIRDDFSNDGTAEILEKYSKKYKFIKVLPSTENIGFHLNIKTILENCTGDYISYLDGDDYWIDNNKLQIQSDFLDKNLKYSMVFGGYFIQFGRDKNSITDYWMGTPPEVTNDLGPDNFVWGNAVNSVTKMFRNYDGLIKDYFYDMTIFDWPLNLEISKHGKIKFLDIPFGVYRKHENSLSEEKGDIEIYNKNKNLILINNSFLKKNMKTRISVLVVNLNNLDYTKQCLDDLLNQDIVFDLRLIDQNSSEIGTKEFFDNFFNRHSNGEFYGKINYLEISNTGFNKPLNHLWNDYVKESHTEFICLLNNDVRLSPNFLSSSISVLEKEPSVGFVNHVTNNSSYSSWSDSLEYVIMEKPYRQGWDPVFRKNCYTNIPENLNFFYGDDFIYSKLYESGHKGAYILNSPIIHFERSTTIEKGGARDCSDDGSVFQELNLEYKNLTFNEDLSKWKPEFYNITEKKMDYTKESYITIKSEQVLLSILVCSLVERNNTFLSDLIGSIEKQIIGKPVELLILSDNAKRPVGTKRNNLLNISKGKYVCFIDDDDRISETYVDDVLQEIIDWSPDVVVFDAEITFNGTNPKLVKYGREYDYCEKSDAYYRHPNHLMVHKKENITEYFKDVKTGEDDEWASRMLPRIVTQSRISKVLYYYDYNTSTKKYFE